MATLNPSLILAQQQYKPPSTDFSETFVQMARMKAYEQQRRLEELKYGQTERAMARDEAFSQLAGQLFTPEQPAAAPAPRGLAGGPPTTPGGPPPPPSLAGATVPPAPGQNFAMAPPPSMPMPDPAQANYQRAPGALQSLATATAPMGGGGGMPGIPAPTSMEPGVYGGGGFSEASPGVQAARGLAVPSPGTPAPQEAPTGLGEAQPGQPKSLLQPLNEKVLAQLFAVNPEKASTLFKSHIDMQESKLKQTEQMNDQIYQVLSALQASPNPAAMYPRALEALRERGIPIPASFPKQYDPALIAFKLKEHKTLKNQIDLSTIELNKQKAMQAHFEGGKAQAEAGRVPTQQRADEALIAQREAETGKAREETNKLINDRKKEAGQVTEYTKDPDWNVYLSQAMQQAKLPPGTPPPPDVIEKARQYQTDDKQKVVRQQGLDAARYGDKAIGEAGQKRLEAANARGSSAENAMNVLDEADRLISEGVYENVPEEQIKMWLNTAGLRNTDAKAARTARLYEIGEQMVLANTPNGSLGAGFSDADRQSVSAAGGGLNRAKTALERQESIKSARKIYRQNMDDANNTWSTYRDTKDFPQFGSARKARLNLLSESDLKEAMAANKWTREQAIANAQRGGYRVED